MFMARFPGDTIVRCFQVPGHVLEGHVAPQTLLAVFFLLSTVSRTAMF